MNAMKQCIRRAALISALSLLLVCPFMKATAYMECGDWGVSVSEMCMVLLAVIIPLAIVEFLKGKIRSRRKP